MPGWRSRRDTDYVLDLRLGHTEVLGDIGEGVAGDEAIDQILGSCAAVNDEGHPERPAWVDDDLGVPICRQAYARSPAIVAVCDALEVVTDDLGKLPLIRSDDGQAGDAQRIRRQPE